MNDYVSPVGRGMPRLETKDKITGKAIYSDDLKLPDMLYGLIVPSPYAHARIKGYDVSAALALEGVEVVRPALALLVVGAGGGFAWLGAGRVRHGVAGV